MALTAEQKLRVMVAADDDPALSDDEIDMLLSASEIVDSNGLTSASYSWTETYNLNIGAREGWRLKMGKIAGRFDFSSDVSNFKRSQFFAHCKSMVDYYNQLCSGYVVVGTAAGNAGTVDPVIGNINA